MGRAGVGIAGTSAAFARLRTASEALPCCAPLGGSTASCAFTGAAAKIRPAAHHRARVPDFRRPILSGRNRNGFQSAKQASPRAIRRSPAGSGTIAGVLRNRVSTAKSVVLHTPGLAGVQALIPTIMAVISLVPSKAPRKTGSPLLSLGTLSEPELPPVTDKVAVNVPGAFS